MLEPASVGFTTPEPVAVTMAFAEPEVASADDCDGGIGGEEVLSGEPPLEWMGRMLLADASVEAMIATRGRMNANNQKQMNVKRGYDARARRLRSGRRWRNECGPKARIQERIRLITCHTPEEGRVVLGLGPELALGETPD